MVLGSVIFKVHTLFILSLMNCLAFEIITFGRISIFKLTPKQPEKCFGPDDRKKLKENITLLPVSGPGPN